MSTRACYTFTDTHQTCHVYKHSDGYPSGAVGFIENAIPLAWELPRFEATDFGAAFIAGNKQRGCQVYLMDSGNIKDVAPGDINYRYQIEARSGSVYVTAYKTSYWKDRVEEKIWEGPLSAMRKWTDSDADAA